MVTNGTETRSNGLSSLYAEAKSMAASPLLYIGAITVVLANETTEWLGLTDLAAVLAIFPTALALLYAQLLVVALLRRRGYWGAC